MTLVTLPDQQWVDAVGEVPGVDLVPDDLSRPQPHHAEVELVVPPYMRAWDTSLLQRMPALRLVQLLTAGYDNVLGAVPDGVLLANAAGVHDASTAELAVGLAIASLRGFPEFARAQSRGEWLRPGILPSLADRRVLVVGYGSVGRAVATRMLAFETTVTAVASRPRAGDDLVARVHGVEDLPSLLPEHDVVVVVVPLLESTRHLVDEDFLGRMPDGALLVNVARGPVADTDALIRHAGRLRLALDVTDPEPLPPGHPLWTAPATLVSPHVGGASTAFRPRGARLLHDQLARFVAGEPLQHLVG
jgi:phosphoglycerate dehydrogenase-like enzyme